MAVADHESPLSRVARGCAALAIALFIASGVSTLAQGPAPQPTVTPPKPLTAEELKSGIREAQEAAAKKAEVFGSSKIYKELTSDDVANLKPDEIAKMPDAMLAKLPVDQLSPDQLEAVANALGVATTAPVVSTNDKVAGRIVFTLNNGKELIEFDGKSGQYVVMRNNQVVTTGEGTVTQKDGVVTIVDANKNISAWVNIGQNTGGMSVRNAVSDRPNDGIAPRLGFNYDVRGNGSFNPVAPPYLPPLPDDTGGTVTPSGPSPGTGPNPPLGPSSTPPADSSGGSTVPTIPNPGGGGIFIPSSATDSDFGLVVGPTGAPANGYTVFNQLPGLPAGLSMLVGPQDEAVQGGTYEVGGLGIGRRDDRLRPFELILAAAGGMRQVLARWFALPTMAASTRQSWQPGASRRAPAFAAQRSTSVAVSDLRVTFVATGNASGDAFRMRVFNPGSTPILVNVPDGLVLEPVRGSVPGATANAQQFNVPGYCVEFAKLPPPAGSVYRIADKATQERLKPVRYILQAARALDKDLHPDSDPALYAQAIRQYALWSRIENWDQKTFGEKFVERTKKNIVDAKQPWTREMETAIRAVVPNRWQDITRVLAQAGTLMSAAQRGNAQ
jgi:hypothetical protein